MRPRSLTMRCGESRLAKRNTMRSRRAEPKCCGHKLRQNSTYPIRYSESVKPDDLKLVSRRYSSLGGYHDKNS
jgi:hypothetical protein